MKGIRLSSVILTIFLVSGIWSCKAQSVAQFTSFNMSRSDGFDYIEWYNSNVRETAKVDTVSLLEIPANTDLAYVHIRPIEGVVNIEMAGGRKVVIDANRVWLVTALFDNDMNIITPIQTMRISGYKFEVRMDRCKGCKMVENISDL